MKKALIWLLFAFLPIQYGCAEQNSTFEYAVNPSVIAGPYDTMMERYKVVKALATENWDSFTENEQATLNVISNHVKLIESRVNSIRNRNVADMEGGKVTIPELGYIYTLAKDAYTMAHRIANNHLYELTSSQILMLQNFDIQLEEMDAKIKALTMKPDVASGENMLTSMLNVAASSLKIIIPVVLGREVYAGKE